MTQTTALDGRSYVVDTSARTYARRHVVADVWSHAMLSGQLWIAPIVQLELLY